MLLRQPGLVMIFFLKSKQIKQNDLSSPFTWQENADSSLRIERRTKNEERRTKNAFYVRVEKVLLQDLTPFSARSHDLVKLAERTNLALTMEQKLFLDEANDLNLEVRYPDYKIRLPEKMHQGIHIAQAILFGSYAAGT
jgi:hypothetical protein